MDKKKVLSILHKLYIGGCVVGAAVFAVLAYDGKGKTENRLAELDAEMVQLEMDRDNVDVQIQTAEDAKVVLNSAATAGGRVAQLQNTYNRSMGNLDAGSIDEDAYFEKIEAVASDLDAFFEEDSNARTPWYYGTYKESYPEWTFLTNYDFDGNIIPVIWVCHGSGGGLLAYTTAIYDADTEIFTSVETHVTYVGARYYPGTKEDPNFDPYADQRSVDNWLEDIQKVLDSDDVKNFEHSDEVKTMMQEESESIARYFAEKEADDED